MTVLLTAVGLFYVFAAALVLRQARMEWGESQAIETRSDERQPDRDRLLFMGGSALVYGAAGLALVVRSGWAVWLLGAGLIMQAVYYAVLAPKADPAGGADPGLRRKAWNAAMISTAAFALAAYGHRIGALA